MNRKKREHEMMKEGLRDKQRWRGRLTGYIARPERQGLTDIYQSNENPKRDALILSTRNS